MDITLSDIERRILAVTAERSMISGAELAEYAETTDWKVFADALKSLQAKGLLEVSGDVWNVKNLPYATIGILPSARSHVYQVLRK